MKQLNEVNNGGSWCIRLTKDNQEIIRKYFSAYSRSYSYNSFHSFYGYDNSRIGVECRGLIFGKELTTEEFERAIQDKKPTESLKDNIGKKVRLIRAITDEDYRVKGPGGCCPGSVSFDDKPKVGVTYIVKDYNKSYNVYKLDFNDWSHPAHVFELVPTETSTELTKLPEKWCIEVTEENKYQVSKYFHSIGKEYVGYDKCWEIKVGSTIYYPQYLVDCWAHSHDVTFKPGYRKLTTEQFYKKINYSVKEHLSGEELLAEAKRRYPVGCTVDLLVGPRHRGGHYVIEARHEIRQYNNSAQISIHGAPGWLHYNGKWAEIVSMPNTSSEEKVPDVPEYVQCVESWHPSWTTGKIYKTDTVQKDFPRILSLKDDKDEESNVVNWDQLPRGFKPSTKEAYDKQQKEKTSTNLIPGNWYGVNGLGMLIKYSHTSGKEVWYSAVVFTSLLKPSIEFKNDWANISCQFTPVSEPKIYTEYREKSSLSAVVQGGYRTLIEEEQIRQAFPDLDRFSFTERFRPELENGKVLPIQKIIKLKPKTKNKSKIQILN